ncbi:hypothetical protein [Anaerofustis stercorihominis]|uniref:hypothetical protein n=1 Tax=Anaerofustis stercorihominis TaxID=214853 RepID=UPI00214B7627|nr:hypothetical protein [Anaerofustis stercorihominis]MCR2033568.1 hypothetical protein [Anaerofustis stercorihominis]
MIKQYYKKVISISIIFIMILSVFLPTSLGYTKDASSSENTDIINSEDNIRDTNEIVDSKSENDKDSKNENSEDINKEKETSNEQDNKQIKNNKETLNTDISENKENIKKTKTADSDADAGKNTKSTVGPFDITGGEINVDYKYEGSILTILTSTTLTIKNTNPASATAARIVVPENVKANLVFAGINIKTTSNSPFTLTPDTNKDGEGAYAHITLTDNTTNTFVSASSHYPGIRAGKTTHITIDDSIVNKDENGRDIIPELGRVPNDVTLQNGTKLKKGDRLTKMDSKNAGSLIITGSNYASGLGGGNGEDGGYITINGGNIKATGVGSGSGTANAGAGIGGGNYAAGGNITINGGIITAQGAYHCAGVGGGYCTSSATKPTELSPAAVDPGTGKAKSGNITINGGLTYSNGGAHGDAFGDGCFGYTTSEKYKIIMTGGTVIPTSVSGRNDLGGTQADVFVLGGSLKASKFLSSGGSVAYGDMDKKTKVFMTSISLTSWGLDKVNTTLVDDLDMKINGIDYKYGVPSYTDNNGNLYFWLPDTNKGAEVSVDLGIIDKTSSSSDTKLDTDTFFAKDVGSSTSGEHLKQYVIYEIPTVLPKDLLTKRYDGLGLNSEEIKNKIAQMSIETKLPENGMLSDASKMEVASQLLKSDGETVEENAEIVTGTSPNGGKYQLIITSTEYANLTEHGFNNAYWGHRAYYKYAEITPADTKTILDINMDGAQNGKIHANKEITLKASVRPADGEGLNCASPNGYVQFYINGKKYKDPVKLTPADKSDKLSNYNYSTADIKWVPTDHKNCIPGETQNIKVVYIGNDPNYTKGSLDNKKLSLDVVNIDTDGDGKPDINIDTDGNGKPDVNIDPDNDWEPEINIDTDGDKKPDINIDTDGDKKPDINIDTDGDKKPDINIDTDGDKKPDINIDTDGDKKPDINIDTDGDKKPDINIDTNDDGKPDINIDTNGDKKPDINIDTNGDGKPDINIDTNDDKKADLNIDTNGDGKPDINIDANGDGIPDENVRSVKTSDESNLILYIIIAVISLIGISVIKMKTLESYK